MKRNRLVFVGLNLVLLILATPAAAQPKMKPPTLQSVMAGSLTDRAKIRWSRFIEGKQVTVTIGAGEAYRLNPNMSNEPAKLPYDLGRNRELERQVKATHLGASRRSVSSVAGDRTLEIVTEGAKDDVVVGRWSMSLAAWKKKNANLVKMLEPLFDVQPDVFQQMKGPEQ